MRSHAEYCPVAKAAETLGDKWSLLIVREMLYGVTRFNELERCLPGISRSVLAERLRQLASTGVVVRSVADGGRTTAYRLTTAGRELGPVVQVLGDWAARWVLGDPQPHELDPDLLMLWISRHMNPDRFPPDRVVIDFALRASRRPHYWLVLEPGAASLCLRHPGFEADLEVDADVAALYQVYLGRMTLADAERRGLVRLEGPSRLLRGLPAWFAWSSFAPAARDGLNHRLSSVSPRPVAG